MRLLARSDAPFIRPTEPYERTGQYAEGTTFVEGLVPFRGRWLLYYGTADSRVGVAVWDPARAQSLDAHALHMHVDHSPYEGFSVTGWPERVYSRGELVAHNGRYVGEPARGTYLHRTGADPTV